MRVRLLPAGEAAVLVEVAEGDDGIDAVLALTAALRGADLAGVIDLVPAARTVLVHTGPGADLDRVCRALADLAARTDRSAAAAQGQPEIEIRVRYDGPDLDEVAELTGSTRSEVIARHTGTRWRAAFAGFAPGFLYLSGGGQQVPRRAEPRPKVRSGSVALAAGYSAVYPQDSPGGWQLIGSSDAALWDLDRDPPALIAPGEWVRFVQVTDDRSGSDESDDPAGHGSAAAPEGAAQRAAPESAERHDEQRAPALEVLRTGPLSLLQDLGRPGLAALGVGRSGAADQVSFLAANRLLGNSDGVAAIECVLGGLSIRADGDVTIAVTGAPASMTIDGAGREPGTAMALRDGQVLTLGTPRTGLRSYLAVRGGFDVPTVLGSRSTDTLSGLGPPPLRRGDRFAVTGPVGDADEAAVQPGRRQLPIAGSTVTLRADAGPRSDWFTDPTDLAVGEWVVSAKSNRVGIRLNRPDGSTVTEAPLLRRSDSRELPSEGLVLGAVQVPPSGQPVLFLADHPVTGGYPVIAVVCGGDLGLAAQLRPGHRLRFQFSSLAQPPEPER